MAAERNVAARGNYTIDDIYNELLKITNLDENACRTLKEIEFATELEQAIPITENLRQVKSNDILISDMYLPEKFLREMLNKVGLLVPVEIVVTSNGKASGRIWKQLVEQNQYAIHIGDNEFSDIQKPRAEGLESTLSILSRMNLVEQYLWQQQENEFAMYLREIRLRNPFAEEIKRQYWEFFTLNVGILILMVQMIDEIQRQHGFEYLGFCGRDTYYLWLLYEKYKRDHKRKSPDCDYLYYSRKLVRNSKADTAKYFRSKINDRKALMIDLQGSGGHLRMLKDDADLKYSTLMCYKVNTSKCPTNTWFSFANHAQASQETEPDFYLMPTITDTCEFFNRATHNTPFKLTALQIADEIIPHVIFSEVCDTENMDVLLSCMREVLQSRIIWGGVASQSKLSAKFEYLSKLFATLTGHKILRTRHSIDDQMDCKFTYK